MSISLQKGQKVSLSKDNAGLSKIIVGLGWDEVQQSSSGGGFLSALFGGGSKQQPIDCDASALMLKNGKLVDKSDIVYFGNLHHKSGTVNHQGDNLTGAGDGDDEQIVIDLAKVPQEYDKIVIVVNIYQAVQRHQHFGMIENAFIRLVDARNNNEMCKYNLTENYSGMTAMIFGEVYRHNGEWKFSAVGQAHAQSAGYRGGNSQCRAAAQNQAQNRVFADDAGGKNAPFALFFSHFKPPPQFHYCSSQLRC